MPRLSLRSTLHRSAAVGGLLAGLLCVPALADEIADVNRFMRGGQHAEALARADAFLAKHPRDAQMRFLKGVILAEQNKASEAIAIFQKLTEDHPTLPEPYNNLAVLYAASGQYEKARTALDAAIRTNPSYATAYENLGDVHAKLASQAYDKALQLDSGNNAAKSKLTLVRSLVTNNDSSKLAAAPVSPAKSAAPAAAPATTPRPVDQLALAKPEPARPASKAADPAPRQEPAAPAGVETPLPKPETPKADVKQQQLAKAEAAAAAKAANEAKEAKEANEAKAAAEAKAAREAKEAKEAKLAKAVNETKAAKAAAVAERNEIAEVVEAWARAWSAQDVKSYLAFYGNDFETPGGQSRKAWEEDRRARIAGKGSIKVKIEAPQVSVDGNNASVRFRQVYISDRLTATTRKTLVLAKQGGRWKIKQENTGS